MTIDSYDKFVENISSHLINNIFYLFAYGRFRERYINDRKLYWGYDFGHLKLIFVVSKLRVSGFNIPNIFWPLFSFIVFIFSIYFLAKVLKFTTRFWNLMNLYNILLGHKIKILSTFILERIIYLHTVFLAIAITAEFVTPTKIKIIN